MKEGSSQNEIGTSNSKDCRLPLEELLRKDNFFVYIGKSMSPTLKATDILKATSTKDLKIGDVIIFRDPKDQKNITHRIVEINNNGISTQGDNNPTKDIFILKDKDIIGKVTLAKRGKRVLKIHGFFRGITTRKTNRIIKFLKRPLRLFLKIMPFKKQIIKKLRKVKFKRENHLKIGPFTIKRYKRIRRFVKRT